MKKAMCGLELIGEGGRDDCDVLVCIFLKF